MAGKHGTSTRAVNSLRAGTLGGGKFDRLFPDLKVAVYGDDNEQTFPGSRAALIALAQTMIDNDAGAPIDEAEPDDENAAIPSGYTYLGQFIDHDLSFDPAAISERVLDPRAEVDFRTPRFDLDSLYGKGPDDEPYLYQAPDYGKFHLGVDVAPHGLGKVRPDLVRNADGRAIIGDPRNNENKLVTQVHALMLAFHNAVWDHTPAGDGRFHKVRETVRWHYQWLVVHDFLAKILDPAVWTRYFGAGKPTLTVYKGGKWGPFIPIEFSVAAYRLGHSMVRPSYSLSKSATKTKDSPRIPIFKRGAKPDEQLNGFEPVPKGWGLDWGFFFPGVNSVQGAPPAFQVPQPSYRMDSVLVMPLGDLPDHHSPIPAENSLPALNLLRSRLLGLPSAQDVHKALTDAGVPLGPALTNDQLWQDKGNVPDILIDARRALPTKFPAFQTTAPLWFYILREAEILSIDDGGRGGKHLGPLGSTIVAETFAALLLADGESYINAPAPWTPTLPAATAGTFTITDVVNYVDAG